MSELSEKELRKNTWLLLVVVFVWFFSEGIYQFIEWVL